MITIKKPYITKDENLAYLRAKIYISQDTAKKYIEKTSKLDKCAWLTMMDYPPAIWDSQNNNLWFSVKKEYADYLCEERSNAFVVALLWYAMITESDICFETPMSKNLYDGLTKKIIPALMRDSNTIISLKGPVTSDLVSGEQGVACGMSCGVDSLYTLHNYVSGNAPTNARLTHLMYCEVDYTFPFVTPPYDIDKIFLEEEHSESIVVKNAETIANRHHMSFLHIRSNLDRDFCRGGVIYSAMYRYLACALALEKLYSLYIISSSGSGNRVKEISLTSPTQNYENLICESLRTEKLNYVISDNETRVNKIREIADDKDFQEFAYVCYLNGTIPNCGECFGCMKTIIPLDILGKLDMFEKVFDIKKYYANRKDIFKSLFLFSKRPEMSFAREIVRQLLKLALDEGNEAGREFIEVYNDM